MLSRALRVAVFAFCALLLCVPASLGAEKPTESQHRHGPAGIEGWTLNWTIPDHPGERFPRTLVIARNGRVLRRFEGAPFVWRWIFWAGGKQVAYELGPLHFEMGCVLADVKTGHELARVDCFQGIPDDAPEWLRRLESSE